MTLDGANSLVKAMRLTDKQVLRVAKKIVNAMKSQNVIQMKVKEEVVLNRVAQLIRGDLAREAELDAQVNAMMDQMERDNPGEFQRYKMFPLLKKRLAKEKGIIL